ncbi:MAG TPA: GNAT family N-acetyltransferase [Caulobacteraceae bacterium]|nr:GNAT family N-acetyltransferase [Caulobacteraceae bacterium]
MGTGDPDGLQVRPYRDRGDLQPLLAFASRLTAARFPFGSGWHPGNFAWDMKGRYDAPQDNLMWIAGGEILAVVAFDGLDTWIEAEPRRDGLIVEALQAAERIARARGHPELRVRAQLKDADRIAALEAEGFEPAGAEGVLFLRDLSASFEPEGPPDGFRVGDCVGLDPDARARAHRDAWNHLGHIGLPEARSTLTGEIYARLTASPAYDPTLDIVVIAPDGSFAANCICWWDATSGVGVFEPVGTSLDWRGRRLARAAIHEGLRRLRARGAQWGQVGTAHFNASAIAAYRACGFDLADSSAWWSKQLTQA